MNKVVIDTSVFVPFLRHGSHLEEILALTKGEILHFSGVVAQELYAGSKDRRFSWQLDKLVYRFKKSGRLVVPNDLDWRTAGLALNRIGKRFGFEKIRRGILVNDALIAAACRREGLNLLTLNEKDFRLLQKEIRFDFRVPKEDPLSQRSRLGNRGKFE